jgi:uncharacterized protein (DUF58 family)
MTRIILLTAIVFLLLFAGLGSIQPGLITLAIPPALYLLMAFWSKPGPLKITPERSLSAERVKTGDDAEIKLTFTNQGKKLEEVLIADELPPGLDVVEGSARHIARLEAGSVYSFTYTLRGNRGYYSLKKACLAACETFGLGSREEHIATSGQWYIQPPVLKLKKVAIQPRRTRIFSGTIPARQGGSGVDFYDVREYQQGDSPRWINWKATARHPQNVFSNQYEQERAADVGLILDGRKRANDFGSRSIFEMSVLATAALADAFLNAGNRVGLLFYGRQLNWTMPGYGRLQGERILHDLSLLETGESQSLNELYVPRHLFPSRSQLVLISPLLPEDADVLLSLRIRGYHLMVISPDPVQFEATALPQSKVNGLAARLVRLQRNVLLQRLRSAAIRVVNWDTREPFEKIARLQLEQHVIPPMGMQR